MASVLERLPLVAIWRREFVGYGWAMFQRDLLAGLTVGAVALPLALAFGVASGANAAAGMVTAILAGLVIAGLGGAPYQISGPTGAMSAVLIVLAQRYGLAGVWAAGLLAGVFLVLLGLFRLGRYISFIPAPVITGFTSGILPAPDDDHLAVDHRPLRQLRAGLRDHLREVPGERLAAPARQLHLVAVAEDDAAEAVPLRLVRHALGGRQLGNALGEHRLDRRVDREIHETTIFSRPPAHRP
jgi:hypothetical protein